MMNPKEKVPIIPPNADNDPIHDNCSFVSGPDFSGDSSDKSTIVAGAIQPFITPWLMKIIFAVDEKFYFWLSIGKFTAKIFSPFEIYRQQLLDTDDPSSEI